MPLLFMTERHTVWVVSVIGISIKFLHQKHSQVPHLVHLFIYSLPVSVCSKYVSNYNGCFSCSYLGQLSYLCHSTNTQHFSSPSLGFVLTPVPAVDPPTEPILLWPSDQMRGYRPCLPAFHLPELIHIHLVSQILTRLLGEI